MNSIRVVIKQDRLIPDLDKQDMVERSIKTEEIKSEELCKFYALYEFYKFYERVEKFKLKGFDLRKTLDFTIYWNEVPFDIFILKRVYPQKYKSLPRICFHIKNCFYTIATKKKLVSKSYKKKSSEHLETRIEPIDLNKTFNTIEFIQNGILKRPTLMISTPMYD